VTVFKGNLFTPGDFNPAGGSSVELDLADIRADLHAVGASVHAQCASDRAGYADEPFHPAEVVFGAVGYGPAEVSGSVHVRDVAFENDVGIRLGQLEDDPGKLAVFDQQVGPASEKAVGYTAGIEQV
jgi:hypothetical protein